MNLVDLFLSLIRRWPITIAGVLLAATAATLTYRETPVTYRLESSVVLLPPATTVGTDGNPFMKLGGLDQALDVLVRTLTAESVQETVIGDIDGAEYAVQRDATTSGPILVIESSAPTAEGATSILDEVRSLVPAELARLQTDLAVAPASQITSREIALDTTPELDGKNRTRLTIAAGGVGLVLTLITVALVDRISVRRARRRDASAPEKAAEDGEDGGSS